MDEVGAGYGGKSCARTAMIGEPRGKRVRLAGRSSADRGLPDGARPGSGASHKKHRSEEDERFKGRQSPGRTHVENSGLSQTPRQKYLQFFNDLRQQASFCIACGQLAPRTRVFSRHSTSASASPSQALTSPRSLALAGSMRFALNLYSFWACNDPVGTVN